MSEERLHDVIEELFCPAHQKQIRLTLANPEVHGVLVTGVPCACSMVERECPKRKSARCLLKAARITTHKT